MKQFVQFSAGFVYFHFVEIHWVLFHFSTYAKRKVTQYLLILTLYQLIMSKKKTKQCSNERKEGRKDQKKNYQVILDEFKGFRIYKSEIFVKVLCKCFS